MHCYIVRIVSNIYTVKKRQLPTVSHISQLKESKKVDVIYVGRP